jgi:hypothetical protein
LDTNARYQAQKFCREQRISIMNQVAFALQDSIDRIGHIPAHLAHPHSIGAGSDASNLHFARGQFEEEENEEPLQPSSGPYFHGEEIRYLFTVGDGCIDTV